MDKNIALSNNDTISLPVWKRQFICYLAVEISTITKYFDEVIQWNPLDNDSGNLLNKIKCGCKSKNNAIDEFPDLNLKSSSYACVLINGNFNYEFDIQNVLTKLRNKVARTTRIVVVAYNSYWGWLYRIVSKLGLRSGGLPTTFLTRHDFGNIAKLSGYQMVRCRPVVYFPWKLFGVGSLINYLLPLIPIIRWFSLTSIIVLRPVLENTEESGLSIIIPAKDEFGNIENILKRMPNLRSNSEIIFVEGHSTDDTWNEINRVKELYSHRMPITSYRQKGKGKGDAVRLGISKAINDLVVILDADLSVPPEKLNHFYEAYKMGLADFINGNRLVYPMDGKAMRFLNRLGNIFFAKALSVVLDMKIGDSLCGTKLFRRNDYHRMIKWREDFGDFDPFGDFELLFPAAIFGLGVIDIPVHYRSRDYGSTNIYRFRHGLMLLKMVMVGLLQIKTGRVK